MANNDTSRRATSGGQNTIDSISKVFQTEAGMSPEKSTKLAKELLKILKDQEQEYTKIVRDVSDLQRMQSKYLGDNVKLTNVFGEQIADLEREQSLLQEKLKKVQKGSDLESELHEQYVQNNQTLEEAKKIRSESVSQLSNEQQQEAELYKLAYERNSADEKRLRNLREEHKTLNAQIKTLKEKGKLNSDEKEFLKYLEKRKSDVTKEEKSLSSKTEGGEGKGLIADMKDRYQEGKADAGEVLSKFTSNDGPFSKAMNKLGGILGGLGNIMAAGFNKLNNYVESAANFLADNKGAVNALLRSTEGITDHFQTFLDKSEQILAAGTLLSQTEYLSTLKQVASQGIGISSGLETAAVLTAVAEKTVPQFSATNEGLRRLVKLGEKNATERFFGLEAIILRSLNQQFGDTSYLNQLFDSVNDTMMDAVANLADKGLGGSYDFRATLQQWMSYLYEQGVDSNTISRITSAMNALGSGNIAALGSDAGMQKLILLAMDKAGQDFATTLQEGLDVNTLNTLMASMTGYLKDLVGKTESNNVLEAAYANLFGLSMTDMYAFQHADKSPVGENAISEEAMLTESKSVIQYLSDNAYTLLSEKIDNALTNMQFTFGQEIANSSLSYGVWKGANLAMDIGSSIGGVVGKGIQLAGRTALLVDSIPALAKTIYHTISGGLDSLTTDTNSVTRLYEAAVASTRKSSGGGAASSTADGTAARGTATGESEFKTMATGKGQLTGEAANIEKKQAEYEKKQQKLEDEGGETTKILKELEKTFMKTKNKKNYAIAVSLEAMDDEVLKSFASIFADEDAMEDVFKTDKDKEKLFDYDGENTSSSDDSNSNSNNNKSDSESNSVKAKEKNNTGKGKTGRGKRTSKGTNKKDSKKHGNGKTGRMGKPTNKTGQL